MINCNDLIHELIQLFEKICGFLIKKFVQGHRHNSSEIIQLLPRFEYTIIPVMNTDGYIYSFEKNRMWR